MKIAMITRHTVPNYGSILQSYALQHTLERLGYTCEIIDYVRKDESILRYELSLLKTKKEWSGNAAKKMCYLLVRYLPSVIVMIHFDRERKKYLNLSQRYSSLEELKQNKPKADCYLSGSDQLWSPMVDGMDDSAYCLSFTADNDVRVAYASSFGRSQLTSLQKEFYRKWLDRFQYISVRENQAVKMLRELNIAAEQVLDPTLLLSKSDWMEWASVVTKKGKYILVYELHNNRKLDRYAKKVAQQKQLPLIRVSPSLHQITRGGKMVWIPAVKKFVSLLANADCLITDSFHGTAFAINLNVPFVNVIAENGTQSRIHSLLDLVGLSNRIVLEEDNLSVLDEEIDYSKVDQIIEAERKRSLQVLRAMIAR